jgi:hypothetical protein
MTSALKTDHDGSPDPWVSVAVAPKLALWIVAGDQQRSVLMGDRGGSVLMQVWKRFVFPRSLQ